MKPLSRLTRNLLEKQLEPNPWVLEANCPEMEGTKRDDHNPILRWFPLEGDFLPQFMLTAKTPPECEEFPDAQHAICEATPKLLLKEQSAINR